MKASTMLIILGALLLLGTCSAQAFERGEQMTVFTYCDPGPDFVRMKPAILARDKAAAEAIILEPQSKCAHWTQVGPAPVPAQFVNERERLVGSTGECFAFYTVFLIPFQTVAITWAPVEGCNGT